MFNNNSIRPQSDKHRSISSLSSIVLYVVNTELAHYMWFKLFLRGLENAEVNNCFAAILF